MIETAKLSKLTVGDIAEYERHVKDVYKKELIEIFKEVHGDNLPVDAAIAINKELKKIPSIFESSGDIDSEGVQYLIWLAIRKSNPGVTLEDVGNDMDTEKLKAYVDLIMPVADKVPVQKKTKRKKKQKDN